jgi:hypothetical protein
LGEQRAVEQRGFVTKIAFALEGKKKERLGLTLTLVLVLVLDASEADAGIRGELERAETEGNGGWTRTGALRGSR